MDALCAGRRQPAARGARAGRGLTGVAAAAAQGQRGERRGRTLQGHSRARQGALP